MYNDDTFFVEIRRYFQMGGTRHFVCATLMSLKKYTSLETKHIKEGMTMRFSSQRGQLDTQVHISIIVNYINASREQMSKPSTKYSTMDIIIHSNHICPLLSQLYILHYYCSDKSRRYNEPSQKSLSLKKSITISLFCFTCTHTRLQQRKYQRCACQSVILFNYK